jgi:ABC-type cobalamin/Fe3+-siderophores transport system ATPase subunit
MALMQVRNLTLGSRLKDISFSVKAGTLLGIIGPNGSGKSTLLHCLSGLSTYQGEMTFAGQSLAQMDVRARAQSIGLMPQSCQSAWRLTVEDIVALGRLPWGDRHAKAIDWAMAQTQVAALRHRVIDELSGGEQARVWMARVIAGCPRLLLADEPLASLDMKHQHSVLASLRNYLTEERAVVLAIHDLGLAARYCEHLCLMHQGALFAAGPPRSVLTEDNLSTVYGIPIHVDLDAPTPIIAVK